MTGAPPQAAAPSAAQAALHPPPDAISLFNDPRFHALNGVDCLQLQHVADGRVIGSIAGALDGARFESGWSAPFGGFDVVRDREAASLVGALVDSVLAQLGDRGVEQVTVRCPPPCHAASVDVVAFTLLQRGFAVAASDLNFHVDLRRFERPEEYVAALRSPARRALRHAAGEPWRVRDAGDDAGAWDVGYELLRVNRARKGRELSLGRDYVERARRTFPERIRMLLLDHAERPVAAALTYRVRPGVELVVFWGDGDHGLPRSPMNQLAHEVVSRAIRERVDVLDIGPSTAPGPDGGRIPDDGLIQFKLSVGAAAQTRLVLTRSLHDA